MTKKLATKKVSRERLAKVEEGEVEMMDPLEPSFAKALLDNRGLNRPLNPKLVDEYARAMAESRWRWVGDTIRLNADMQVIDGQHRLAACVRSNVSMRNVILVTLKSPDAIKSIDLGKPRSMRDQLTIEQHGPVDNAILAGVMAEKSNWVDVRGRYSREERISAYDGCPFTQHLLKLKSITKFKRDTWNAGPVSAAIRCMRRNPSAAMEFFGSVFSGSFQCYDAIDVRPSRMYFEFLINRQRNKQGMLPIREAAYKGIRAYNMWRTNEEREVLRYADNVPIPEVET